MDKILQEMNLMHLVEIFKEEEIDKEVVLLMTDVDFFEIGCSKEVARLIRNKVKIGKMCRTHENKTKM